MARLTIDGLSKSFGAHAALKNLSMTIEHGEFVAILGPSGCGKTTMLRLVAGFDTVTSGTIAIGDMVVSGPGVHVPPEQRRTGIVFQSYALWPHMDVGENVAYALRIQKVPAAEREARVAKALEAVGLTSYKNRRPATLSGGQRQRVALARCLAVQPEVVLLDEPLANLDVHLRASMEEEFAAFHRRTGTTMFYITHDQAEAMALADRIAVMDHGEILQVATPSQLYREPVNPIVARFIGAGMVLPAQIEGKPKAGRVKVNVLGHSAVVRCRPETAGSGMAAICVRAGDLRLAESKADGKSAGIPGHVHRLIYQGGHFCADITLDGEGHRTLQITLPEPAPVKPGDAVRIIVSDGWLIPEGEAHP